MRGIGGRSARVSGGLPALELVEDKASSRVPLSIMRGMSGRSARVSGGLLGLELVEDRGDAWLQLQAKRQAICL